MRLCGSIGNVILLTLTLLFSEPLLDLETAWSRTLSYAPSLEVADYQVAIQDSERKQQALRPNPFVGVEIEDVLGTGKFRNGDSDQKTYSLSQLIELGGKRRARARFAGSQTDMSFWDAQITRQDLKFTVVSLFLTAFIAQEKVKIAKEREDIATATLNIVEAQIKAGKVSPILRKRTKVLLKLAEVARVEAVSQVKESKRKLSSMWGNVCCDFEVLTYGLKDYNKPPEICEVLPRVLDTPDMVKTNVELASAEENIRLQKANGVPDLTVRAAYRNYGYTSAHSYVFEAEMPLPIFNYNQGSIQKARRLKNQAFFKQEEALRVLREKVAVSYQEWVAAYDKIEIFQGGIMHDAEDTYRLTELGYKKGKLQYLDILDAQRTLFEVQEQYLDVLYAYHLKKAEVERYSGDFNGPGIKFERDL